MTLALRVLIADDHPVVRAGIKRLLQRAFPDASCQEAAHGAEVVELVRAVEWDLLILDLHMPRRGGLDMLMELRRLQPQLPILVLSMYAEEHYALRVLSAGAAGYLGKEAAVRELVTAVSKILDGERYLSEQVVTAAEPAKEARLIAALSPRELQALRLIGLGHPPQQIAAALGVSCNTAQYYRSRLLNKLGLKRTSDLILFCERHGVNL